MSEINKSEKRREEKRREEKRREEKRIIFFGSCLHLEHCFSVLALFIFWEG